MLRKAYIAPAIGVISMQTEGLIAGSNSHNGGSSFGRMPVDGTNSIDNSRDILSRELEESSNFWEDVDENYGN